jgi:RNA polymerase sigma-70 factor (ECF subfamily)
MPRTRTEGDCRSRAWHEYAGLGGTLLTQPTQAMPYECDDQPTQNCATVAQTDEQLMARIQAREESALTILCRRHTFRLRTILSRIVNNEHDVDCLLNAVFLDLWNRAGSYDRTKGVPLAWMITMARCRAIDTVRRRQCYDRATERFRLAREGVAGVVRQHSGDDYADANERAAILQRMFQSLPEAQREAVKLAYYGGFTQREIAVRIGVPLGTIKTRVELGIRKLRTALNDYGGVEEWLLAH